MKIKKWVLGAAIALITVGCGNKGGAKSDGGCGSKDLFSNWTYQTSTLSLSGFQFNQPASYQIQFAGGEICQMEVTIAGTQCSGSIGVTNSTYTGGGAGDPGCASLNGPNIYTKSSAGLHVCDVSGCTDYQ